MGIAYICKKCDGRPPSKYDACPYCEIERSQTELANSIDAIRGQDDE